MIFIPIIFISISFIFINTPDYSDVWCINKIYVGYFCFFQIERRSRLIFLPST